MRKVFVISIILNLLLIVALCYVGAHRTDYFKRVYTHVIGEAYVPERSDYDCVNSWNSCIRKLNLDVDVVFFGNSITEGGEWQDYFPNRTIITLAYIGEDIKGMLRRVNSIADVTPEIVFLMAGINGLNNQSLQEFERWYGALLDSICNVVPEAHIYVQNILPVSAESVYCSSQKIVEANCTIESLVLKKASDRVQYVDLWSVYETAGNLPDELTYDGLHLNDDAYSYWVNAIRKYVEK